jgi:PD-(D/E)XK nuclease superfamily protein
VPWARASSLHRHLVCPASCSLPQFDRGKWRPGHLQIVTPAQLAERTQTELERGKQTVWGTQADWGTAMHAAKAGLQVDPFYRDLLAPHREKLWPARLGLHEVGVSFNCDTRAVDMCVGSTVDVDAWKNAQPAPCVVGTVDWWAYLPTGEPWIDDLKTSKWEPDTVTEQTMLYLLCRTKDAQFSGWDTGRISVTHIPREEDPFEVEAVDPARRWKQLSRFTLDEFEDDVVAAWHRAKEAEPRAVPGVQCEYCPSALVCTKGRD